MHQKHERLIHIRGLVFFFSAYSAAHLEDISNA